MVKRNAVGQVCRVFSYSGPMYRHSGWHKEETDATIAALDSAAHVKVAPAGVLRRRNGQTVKVG